MVVLIATFDIFGMMMEFESCPFVDFNSYSEYIDKTARLLTGRTVLSSWPTSKFILKK